MCLWEWGGGGGGGRRGGKVCFSTPTLPSIGLSISLSHNQSEWIHFREANSRFYFIYFLNGARLNRFTVDLLRKAFVQEFRALTGMNFSCDV